MNERGSATDGVIAFYADRVHEITTALKDAQAQGPSTFEGWTEREINRWQGILNKEKRSRSSALKAIDSLDYFAQYALDGFRTNEHINGVINGAWVDVMRINSNPNSTGGYITRWTGSIAGRTVSGETVREIFATAGVVFRLGDYYQRRGQVNNTSRIV